MPAHSSGAAPASQGSRHAQRKPSVTTMLSSAAIGHAAAALSGKL